MKNIILIFLITSLLSGCNLWSTRPPIIETKISKVKVPTEFLDIPPYGKKIDTETATQKEVSQWILDTEERMYILERNIFKIKEFNEKSITEKDIK